MIYDLKEVVSLYNISFGKSRVIEIKYMTIGGSFHNCYKVMEIGESFEDMIPKHVYDYSWTNVYGLEKHLIPNYE